jgi:hypothetical protein
MGFEPMIPAFERAKTVHALDRAATVIGEVKNGGVTNLFPHMRPWRGGKFNNPRDNLTSLFLYTANDAKVKSIAFWDLMPCTLESNNQYFE